MNNGHFTRQNHNNKNRNRNRNRRHSSSGGGNHGGSGSNRVLDSNGPDVKLRGTAQTIAEKYIQLGRDAQLSGDNVMAESYYQHGEHYYRVWLANQPAGAPTQFARRPGDDEYEDEQSENADGDEENTVSESIGDTPDLSEQSAVSEDQDGASSEGQQQNRQFRNRDGNKEGGRENGRDRFKNRWPRRNDRNAEPVRENESAQRTEPLAEPDDANANWVETPSFLTRPVPTVAADGPIDGEVPAANVDVQPERRPRREFRPRRARETAAEPGDTPVTQDE